MVYFCGRDFGGGGGGGGGVGWGGVGWGGVCVDGVGWYRGTLRDINFFLLSIALKKKLCEYKGEV
jgi:hypothetical protein